MITRLTQNFRFARLWACDLPAKIFFSSSEVLVAPAVILRVSSTGELDRGTGSWTHSSESMKLRRPVRMVATDHAAFHLPRQLGGAWMS